MANCHSCGASLPSRIYRTTQCDACEADAKVCLNCDFYDKGSHWECRETISEPVRDKDRANFCDFFRPATRIRAKGNKPGDTDQAHDAFSRLFGDE